MSLALFVVAPLQEQEHQVLHHQVHHQDQSRHLHSTTRLTPTATFFLPSSDNSGGGGNSMVLSKNDLQRLTQLRSRQLTLPLLLVQDSLLPGQVMELASTDGKFKQMLSQLDTNGNHNDNDELCVVGMHPYNPGEPLNVGVSVVIEEVVVQRHHSILKVRGKDIVDVQGQPRFHSQKSCFLADLEVAQDVDTMLLTRHHLEKAANWYDELVPLTTKWYAAMMDAGHDDVVSLRDINAVETTTGLTTRAHAVASLLNPSPSALYQVSMEIRPALLACRNEYDRLHLVHTALQASLQQLVEANHDDGSE